MTIPGDKPGADLFVEQAAELIRVNQALEAEVRERRLAEAALRASEERLALALEVSQIGAWFVDPYDHTAHRTLRHDQIFGYETLLPRWTFEIFLDHVLPEDREAVERSFRTATSTRTSWNFECRIRRPDGEVRWIWLTGGYGVESPDGPTRMSGLVEDITLRKRADEMQALEIMLRKILQRSPDDDMFAEVLDFVLLRFNSPVGFFGYLHEAGHVLVCPSITREVGDKGRVESGRAEFPREMWSGPWGQVLEERRPLITNTPHPPPQGHRPLVRSVSAPIIVDAELIGALYLANRDHDYRQEDLDALVQICSVLGPALNVWLHRRTLEQRREEAEAALRTSELQFRSIIAASPVPCALNDANQNIIYLNPAFTRSFGYDLSDIPTLADWWPRAYPDPGYRQLVADSWRDRIEAAGVSGQPFEPLELTIRAKDGGDRTAIVGASPLAEAFAGVYLVTLIDITARKQEELERQSLEVQLRQAQKLEAIGTLAGGIAHDFNNILGSILFNTTLVRDDVGDGHPAMQSLKQIEQSAQRAARLVSQILAFSRQEAIEHQVVNLRAAIEEDLGLLRPTLPATVEIVTRFSDDAPEVFANPTELDQVCINLCTNAWQAMQGRPGRIEVTLDVVIASDDGTPGLPLLRAGRYARLSVRDSGQGMDARTRERIFDPFFTTKKVGEGTGLGLAVVHRIVTRLQGAIVVDSVPGVGTTFEVYLPAVEHDGASASPSDVQADAPRGHGQHVLFVDDELALVEAGAEILGRLGYRVSYFTGAVDALAALRAAPDAFDVVITDYNLQNASGVDLARDILAVRPGLPIVLVSGLVSPELEAEAAAAGLREILPKPHSVGDLRRMLYRLLEAG